MRLRSQRRPAGPSVFMQDVYWLTPSCECNSRNFITGRLRYLKWFVNFGESAITNPTPGLEVFLVIETHCNMLCINDLSGQTALRAGEVVKDNWRFRATLLVIFMALAFFCCWYLDGSLVRWALTVTAFPLIVTSAQEAHNGFYHCSFRPTSRSLITKQIAELCAFSSATLSVTIPLK